MQNLDNDFMDLYFVFYPLHPHRGKPRKGLRIEKIFIDLDGTTLSLLKIILSSNLIKIVVKG